MNIFNRIKGLFSPKKSSQDDVVSSVKDFKLKLDIPGISDGNGENRKGLEVLKRIIRKASGNKKSDVGAKIKTVCVKGFVVVVSLVFVVMVFRLTGLNTKAAELLGNIEYFHIDSVSIVGCKVTDKRQVQNKTKIDHTRSILTLNSEEIQKEVESFPWISSAKVHIQWPNKVLIKVKEHTPEALIALGDKSGQQLYYIAKNGLPFSVVRGSDELDYPVITGLSTIEEVEADSELTKDIFTFLGQAKKNNPRLPLQVISEIHITPERELVVYLVEHTFPIYMGRGQMKTKYYQLLNILGVLYKKHRKGAKIAEVASIRIDYYDGKALVSLIE